jgi:ubiquinone/menaquinone biosynthesis C-methylase UbiE
MSLRERIFAAAYDRLIAATEEAGLRAQRERVIAAASGRVLEIGGGTGANLGFYGPAVESVTLTEPAEPMRRRLEAKLSGRPFAVEVVAAPAEELPFEDASFDTAVSTLVLCSVDDQARALVEMRRVLRPSGRLLFLEHVRSPEARLARWQDRLNWLNKAMVCCDCNRDTLTGIRRAGFSVLDLERDELPKAPPFARPVIRGTAQIAGVER